MLRVLAILLLPLNIQAQITHRINPAIQTIVDDVSEERIASTLKHLETFGTRNLMSSDTDPDHGIGASRRWIFAEFQTASPRLQIRYDMYHVKKHGRVIRDLELNNIVALLPGAKHPERQILITAHYDSVVMVEKPAPTPPPDAALPEEKNPIPVNDPEKTAVSPVAPGVTDDGSGVALVLELARVMSRHEFDATLVFIAFSGEEQGLIGSTLYAAKAKAAGDKIEAVLNSDIIGSDVTGDGRRGNRVINVYSGDPNDSPSRSVARYIKEIGERYMPAMQVNLVFRPDRFARGGDHTPFDQSGYAAVRFTTPTENFQNQHTVTDTFENTSPSLTASVAKINAAVAASLALAPAAPLVTRELKSGENKGRIVPRITRGKSEYDAILRWSPGEPDSHLLGYAIMMRSTLASNWEKELFVGNVLEYTFPNVSIDDVVFGVEGDRFRGKRQSRRRLHDGHAAAGENRNLLIDPASPAKCRGIPSWSRETSAGPFPWCSPGRGAHLGHQGHRKEVPGFRRSPSVLPKNKFWHSPLECANNRCRTEPPS